jgi:hypothetical protein
MQLIDKAAGISAPPLADRSRTYMKHFMSELKQLAVRIQTIPIDYCSFVNLMLPLFLCLNRGILSSC